MALYIESPARFGAAVRHLRLQRGLTMAALAEMADISVGAIRRIERGLYSPRLRVVLALAQALGREVALDVSRGADAPTFAAPPQRYYPLRKRRRMVQ